ncbi:ATP-dependent helicase HrpB [Phenylobacterium montanum]|uniref:ATP-dependent helicase HrpB n=1 Tax=Phenylobacterium montanum TaxID=2823693 RepID=A0A975G0V0_9CAUL|nr:ATP-dependent helicase HrpB [Caulobacter sp. S6]QUD89045.1 ATP-dependent helicase HrpB [Caulobacter sp. S6]
MLPIHDALPALKAALAERSCAVVVAPPGAGKTTVAPLALKDEPWVAGGKLIVLEPRRLAARAAAARMAQSLGEPVGETVGFRVRLESRVSARTRIEVVTEGVFTRMITADPGLDGVAAVLFDEFHERSLDADLGLAFARDSQGLLRPDLRLVVMSATLDGAAVARLLDGAPVIESQGRAYPVETRYLGRDPAARIEDQAERAVRKALAEAEGGVLVFLPGQGEILRTAERLAARFEGSNIDIAPLYGALEPKDQDRAIAPSPPGRRKVVLATAIAETSLTLEGVRVVIDAGLARVPRFDPASGLTRLETVRVSRASADQRRGRAGRTAPGVCYRLWDEPETRSLIAFERPEILETDLSRLALDLARWGARDADELSLLDRPPAAALAEARALLTRLGALDAAGALTAHGRAMGELPLAPRLAHMVMAGAARGAGRRAARIAALLTERGLGGRSADIATRLEGFARDSGPRAKGAAALADRWARLAGGGDSKGEIDDGLLVAEAFPERIAKARGKPGEYQLANGRGVTLDPADSLAREPWLAVAELGAGEARDRILLAARLDETALRVAFADRLVREERLEASPNGRLRAKETLWLGRLAVEERLITDPDPALIRAALLDEVRRRGLEALPWGAASRSLRERAAFVRASGGEAPDFSDEALLADLEAWLGPLLAGRTSLNGLADSDLLEALRGLAPWDVLRRLDAEAPVRWTAPTGTTHAIDYAAEGGPRVDIRVQELFGLNVHPTVGRSVPLTLALLSPAHRPIQLTKDLPGFWRGSWSDVRKDMRGRYPKHVWPEDPAAAAPTLRAKPRAG